MTAVRFTSWGRLEPSTSDPDLSTGMVAEIADPAWFLARQWQLGELTGDDASTPALVEIETETAVPSRVRLGGASAATAYDPAAVPLDVLAEREPAPPVTPALLAAEASLILIEELSAAGMSRAAVDALTADLRAGFILPALTAQEAAALSPRSASLLAAVSAVSFDGVAVARALPTALPAAATGVQWNEAHGVLRDWVAARMPIANAWVPEQFGSRIEVGIAAHSGDIAYRADRVAGDGLAWWSFDRIAGGLAAGGASVPQSSALPATSLNFPGAPAARYWEMEDAGVDFGAVGVAPNELARLVVLDYLLLYANDMLVVPLDVPYGSRCVVTAVRVIDSFGDRTAVPPVHVASAGSFRLWEVTGDAGALLVPPVAVTTLEGPAIEEALVARDEQSNVAWLIQLTGTDPAGGAVDVRDLAPPPAAATPVPPPAADAKRPPWRWTLAGHVPAHWHPLLPGLDVNGRGRLVVGTVGMPGGRAPEAGSRFLSELGATGLPTAAVPPEGVKLRRRAESTRWVDGSRHIWIARTRRAGFGDVGSGLLFDVLKKRTP